MNEPRITKDDPRLTAYALGELEGDERAEVEAAVCAHPALRAHVDEIRALAGQIEDALTSPQGQEGEVAHEIHERPEKAEAGGEDEVLAGDAPAAKELDWEARVAAFRPDEEATTIKPKRGRAGRRGAPRKRRKVVRFPAAYYWMGALAAACFALGVAWNYDAALERQRVREENLRVAWEKRAAEARAAAAKATAVAVQMTSAPAGDAEAETRATEVGTLATAAETRVAFAPEDLRLLEQVKGSTVAEAGPMVFGSMTGRAARAPGPLSVGPVMGSDGALARGIALGTRKTAAEAEAERMPRIEFVPGGWTGPTQGPGGGSESFAMRANGFAVPAGPAPRNGFSDTATIDPDVVMMSAFTVNERPATTMAMASAARRRSEYEFETESRDYRPRAPAGAQFGRSSSTEVRDNDFLRAQFFPVSTFSAEVDSASYANVRRLIARGQWPVRDVVRIEEMLNYFPYRYPEPATRRLSWWERLGRADGAPPFAATIEVAAAPWAPEHRLVRIGLKARDVPMAERPAANLVFLVDVSQSMSEPSKLLLVKEALRLLVRKLRPDDRVAIVTYGGNGGVALASTAVAHEREIVAAIDGLATSGLADGTTGIWQAYEIAQANFAEGGINRVILCTDGDFAVGTRSETELLRLVEARAGSGVFLSVMGFGMRDYRDAMLEKLADRGNGNFGYIDSRREAQKLFVDEVSSTLVTIAKDVKIQVEFDPAKVASYRLIGYENRLLRREDFNTDEVDAGEIGAGHRVTALYEVVPVAGAALATTGDGSAGRREAGELLRVKLRYKKPTDIFGRTSVFPVRDAGATFAQASADFRFAAAVAQLGMILRKSPHQGGGTIGDVIAWAAAAAANPADDPGGYRGDFIDLARRVQELLRGSE